MKKLILSVMLAVAVAFTAKSQQKVTTADFPNWVVESNIKTPQVATVKFYNAKQELIYQEKISGKKIKIEKPKVQKALNEILNQLITKQLQPSDTALVFAVAKNW